MRTVSILANVGLALFTALVIVSDGMPTQIHFVALSLLLLLVPVITAAVISLPTSTRRAPIALLRHVTIGLNGILVATSCWALVTRYPSHPDEPGLFTFAVLTVFAPVLSLLVLAREPRTFRGPARPAH